MILKIETIVSEFTHEEKRVLEKVAMEVNIFTKTENEILSYFQSTDLVKTGDSYSLSVPLIALYLRQELQKNLKFTIHENGKVYFSNGNWTISLKVFDENNSLLSEHFFAFQNNYFEEMKKTNTSPKAKISLQ